MSLFRSLRIAVLLLVLVVVAGNQFLGQARLADWSRPVWITVYPVVADTDPATRNYAGRLTAASFTEIGDFLTREGRRYGIEISRAARFQVAGPLTTLPPAPPNGRNRIGIGFWSLKMRWWAWRRAQEDRLPDADIQVFVLYRRGEGNPVIDRSIGMQKGRYAVVNAYAIPRMARPNRVVITHELLHVFGATDKYDPYTNQPLEPAGLAIPGQTPRYPQSRAEIMGGRIALSRNRARMPRSLDRCVIGLETAREIGWKRAE